MRQAKGLQPASICSADAASKSRSRGVAYMVVTVPDGPRRQLASLISHKDPHRRWFALEPLDLDPGDLSGAGLGQLGCSDVAGEDVGLPWMHMALSARRVVGLETMRPWRAASRRSRTSSRNTAAARRAPRALNSLTISPAAMPRSAASCEIDPNRFPPPDLGGAAEVAVVQLAVQPLMRLIADQIERIGFSSASACALGGYHARMTAAIVSSRSCRRSGRKISILPDGVGSEAADRVASEGTCRAQPSSG